MPKAEVKKAIDVTTIKRLALEASVDPRTIQAILDGRAVRGMAGERALKVLVDAGYLADDGASK